MMGIRKFFDAMPLAAIYPTFAFTHSVYAENLTDFPFGGLYRIVCVDNANESLDTCNSLKEAGIDEIR